jgi:hypothetical protein
MRAALRPDALPPDDRRHRQAPDEHGIVDFLLIDPDTGKRVPMSSRFRKVRA